MTTAKSKSKIKYGPCSRRKRGRPAVAKAGPTLIVLGFDDQQKACGRQVYRCQSRTWWPHGGPRAPTRWSSRPRNELAESSRPCQKSAAEATVSGGRVII